MDLDATDRRILGELQRDGAQSAADVATKLGLSNTTCWRRIQQLEQDGVIRRRVALLDRKALGLDVMVYVHVRLSTQGRDALAQGRCRKRLRYSSSRAVGNRCIHGEGYAESECYDRHVEWSSACSPSLRGC